jgi:predicted nuclease of restriction endonuclease-like (RecB) superfamily
LPTSKPEFARRGFAPLAVNSELIGLYWRIGRDILERQEKQGWGSKIVERLAADLRAEFPDARGFSSANLRYMKSFAEAWPDPAILQRLVGKLPWGQNIEPLAVKDSDARLWYAEAVLENGWSPLSWRPRSTRTRMGGTERR